MSSYIHFPVIWWPCVKEVKTWLKFLQPVLLKTLLKPRNTNPKPAAASGDLANHCGHQNPHRASWWHLKPLQNHSTKHCRGSFWETFYSLSCTRCWLWISIQNAGCFLLPGSGWESVEGCLSCLTLGISQAVSSIWASLHPLMFSTIYNESFGRHLKPCKVLNH